MAPTAPNAPDLTGRNEAHLKKQDAKLLARLVRNHVRTATRLQKAEARIKDLTAAVRELRKFGYKDHA